MKIPLLRVAPVLACLASLPPLAAQDGAPWISLFNGKDLSGWSLKGGRGNAYVENGEIVCHVTANSLEHTFLCTDESFADFILEVDVKIDGDFNTGISFRAVDALPGAPVKLWSYMVKIDPTPRSWTGGIFEDFGPDWQWLYTLEDNPRGRAAFKIGAWNRIRVEALGAHSQVWVNGVPTANLIDDRYARGYIALKIHWTGNFPEREKILAHFKNVRIITSHPERFARETNLPLQTTVEESGIKVPPDFRALLVADNLVGGPQRPEDKLQSLAVGPGSEIYARTLHGGIIALQDLNGDSRADIIEEFGRGGGTGLALHDGWLYTSTPGGIIRYRCIPGKLVPAGEPQAVSAAGNPLSSGTLSQMLFYTGDTFPRKYRGGAFVACNGSSSRGPGPQSGDNICFVPCDSRGTPTGAYEIFADGFAGGDPSSTNGHEARFRPGGLALGPDGTLYIGDSEKGRIWRIIYTGQPGAPAWPTVSAAIQSAIAAHEVAGAVTVVATKDKIVHLQASGLANIAAGEPMRTDSLFWIASMTKPVTAVAVLLLQDEGKLDVAAPVANYLPEFAALKTPAGQPARITIAQLLTHTSGLGEAADRDAREAHTLADLVRLYLAAPMQFAPGLRWKFCQSGINTAARIVEVVSGQSFDTFVEQRILGPLRMQDTTFYPNATAGAPLAAVYAKNPATGLLEPASPRSDVGRPGDPPFGNMGLYSTGPDYARFCQMLLRGGLVDGRRFLSPAAIRLLTTIQTGDLPSGFLQSPEYGSRGANYGWGLGTCILRTPHDGVAAMLSPGTYGHGGGWGTQAWIDPERGVAYVLMVQRSNFANGDNSDLRRAFQQAAVEALKTAPFADSVASLEMSSQPASPAFTVPGLGHPRALAADRAGNLYEADADSAAVRKITPAGAVGFLGGAQPTAIKDPTGLAVTRDGIVFVADADDDAVYRITPGGPLTALPPAAGEARFKNPTSVSVDSHGNIFVANNGCGTIVKITQDGAASVFAGKTGASGSADGIGSAARFSEPRGIAIDANDNLYVADEGNSNIRKITPGGIVSTLAGAAGQTGHRDGAGTAARFAAPRDLAADAAGTIYVADTDNHCIRRISSAGVVSTLSGQAGQPGLMDGEGDIARFSEPRGIAIDPLGNVYVADTGNRAIRRITPDGLVTTVAAAARPVPAPVAAGPFVPAPAPLVPPGRGPTERSDFSRAQTLAGWDADPAWWSVKDGAFVAKGAKVPSNFLLTQKSYSDFRLTLWSRVVESENHAGVCLWGERRVAPNGKNRWAYQGPLVIFPGLGLWDYSTNKDIPIDPVAKVFAKKITGQHDWIQVEILAQGNRLRVAYNGRQVLDWREPNPGRLRSGPIGLQLHGYLKPQEVIYKDVVIETFPKEDRLITLRP